MKEVAVALLGFGNVGRAFASYVSGYHADSGWTIGIRCLADSSGAIVVENPHQLAALISHKNAGKDVKSFTAGRMPDLGEFVGLLGPLGIDVLVESLPTRLVDGQPALGLIKTALEAGTHVVTVDKGPLVRGFEALKQACAAGARLGYAGTTGVWPSSLLKDAQVIEIEGVLNGTTNHILTAMQRQQGVTFEKALAEAQEQGIAEPDPSLDIDGWDTACKILILAKTLIGSEANLEDVSRIGIGPQTHDLIEAGRATSRTVRLVGRARIWQDRVRISVAPKLVDSSSPFFSVDGTAKAALFRTREAGEILCAGRSGRHAISQTIVDDIINIMERSRARYTTWLPC